MTYAESHEPSCETCVGDDGISLVISARTKPVGNFTVTRALPTIARRMIGPFIFLDHMGPLTFAAGTGSDVLPHPHIGLSTVTYLFEGDVFHRDTLGNAQRITPGDVNLMTAGRGIAHSERTPPELRASGSTMHGLQFWVALTEADEIGEPSFSHVPKEELPRLRSAGVEATVVLGSAYGLSSPLPHNARPLMVDVRLDPGASFRTPPEGGLECGIYVVSGSIRLAGRTFGAHTLVVTSRPDVHFAAESASRVVVLGGPVLGKRFIDWNFVSSSKERIEQAKEDWKARRFPLIPGDDTAFVPLPEPRRTP